MHHRNLWHACTCTHTAIWLEESAHFLVVCYAWTTAVHEKVSNQRQNITKIPNRTCKNDRLQLGPSPEVFSTTLRSPPIFLSPHCRTANTICFLYYLCLLSGLRIGPWSIWPRHQKSTATFVYTDRRNYMHHTKPAYSSDSRRASQQQTSRVPLHRSARLPAMSLEKSAPSMMK